MNLGHAIETLHRLAHRHWAEAGLAIGLSYSEFEYLRAIKDQESRMTDRRDHGQHLQDVVAEMGVRKASASAMVLKLEERGLVERIPCRMDARAQHILLTGDGKAMLRRGEEIYEAVAGLFLANLPDADRPAAETLLADLSLD